MPTSFRLEPGTERALERLAGEQGKSKSDVLREAIGEYIARNGRSSAERPFDRVAHLIGCVDSGRGDLSVNTGEKVRKILAEKYARRRRLRR